MSSIDGQPYLRLAVNHHQLPKGAAMRGSTSIDGSAHVIEHDAWMTCPDDVDCLAPAERWCRVCAKPDREHICTTCGQRADSPYRNAAADEGCIDPIHGSIDCGCGWGRLCEYSDNPLTQLCRDCGQPFPYDPDADRCPACVAAQIPA